MERYLPEEMEEIAIEDMLEGEVAYTVPWAMSVAMDGTLWINRKYTPHVTPGGVDKTTNMKFRMGKGSVEIERGSIGDHKYSRGGGWANFKSSLPAVLVDCID